ncbi:MAG TPA: SHOCT domain-containing protein [Patescibacteria group bacterium]|nr:SHOCT domain-containing protein [Patescibacteria group bacterium]
MMGWGYFPMIGGWFGMMLIPLILIGLAIYVVIKLTSNHNNVRNERPYDNSLEILNTRFAKGEIDEEEYNRKKELLLKR